MGSSDEFLLSPETMPGAPIDGQVTTGGLPIRPGTECETITSSDLRDANGGLKRHAARFRIFQYSSEEARTFPSGGGVEVRIGSMVDTRRVVDIVWTVHLANKKANAYQGSDGLGCFEGGKLPAVRNPQLGNDPNSMLRRRKLIVDPGPRSIRGQGTGPVGFDRSTIACHAAPSGEIRLLPNYPRSFPRDHFAADEIFEPSGPIETLGELWTDAGGRLVVVGGYGRAVGWRRPNGELYPFDSSAENAGWFDDTSDGPVCATLVLDDGSLAAVHGAWVVATDPSFAPQSLNVVSLWDDVYDTWIRSFELRPDMFSEGEWQLGYRPAFEAEIRPFMRSAAMQRWTTNLPSYAIKAHQMVDGIGPDKRSTFTPLAGLLIVRKPDSKLQSMIAAPLMPLSLGDQGKPFLAPTQTQYFCLGQWRDGRFEPGEGLRFGPGEQLDRASLANCLGGRLNPGIDMPFVLRVPSVWARDWKTSGAGPFRLHFGLPDYDQASSDVPFLTRGWLPFHAEERSLEPGDLLKFMALPWHTDFNACAIHKTKPNPTRNKTIYWAWPAQRPVAVYAALDVREGELGEQRWSIRGPGTDTDDPDRYSRFQNPMQMITDWHRIGTVIQATAIDEGGPYEPDTYLEVQSLLDVPGAPTQPVLPWKLNAKR